MKTAEYASIALHVLLFVAAATTISALVQFVLVGKVSMTVTFPASVGVALGSAYFAQRRKQKCDFGAKDDRPQ